MTLKLINSKTKYKLLIGITKEVMSFHFSVKCFDEKVPATKKSPDEELRAEKMTDDEMPDEERPGIFLQGNV